MEILSSLSSGNANMENIKGQLFDVIKTPLITGLEGFENPNSFGVYRTTGGKALGTVGSDYTPTQPKLLFEEFENCLYQTDCDFNEVKYLELKEGKKIVFEATLGKMKAFNNVIGKEEEIIMKMNLSTGFDGLTKSSVFISCYRTVCSNLMKAWRTEFAVSFKNTKGNVGKVSSLCNDIAKATDSINDFEEYIRQLNRVSVDTAKVEAFLLKTVGYNEAIRSELGTVKKNNLDAIQESIELEFSRTGSTLWGLVNGITHYTNHVAKTDNRSDYVLVGGGLKMNDLAQKVALEMAY